MKKLTGAFLVIVSLLFFTLLVLRIWGISIVSWPTILRSGATFVALGGLIVILAIVYFLFFKSRNSKQGYN